MYDAVYGTGQNVFRRRVCVDGFLHGFGSRCEPGLVSYGKLPRDLSDEVFGERIHVGGQRELREKADRQNDRREYFDHERCTDVTDTADRRGFIFIIFTLYLFLKN